MLRSPAILRPSLFAVALTAGTAVAQQGDRPGETQPPPPASLVIPPAPVLTPAEGLASITVKDGFRVELVASEPLVEDPVQMAFDERGRLWVVEMRGFMPNVDGTGELEPVGRIVVLEDRDGDGRMDDSTVFVEGLVLPRSVAPVFGGALVIQPPDLVFHRDTDGDGRADEHRVLYTGFGGLDSPEHAGNGLVWGIDNWLHVSQHPLRFRFDGERLAIEPTPGHGQWGVARDDVGRVYYTTNSDPLRADLVPLHYAARNPSLRRFAGVNVRLAHDMAVWPIRVTPGINRGYQPHMLRDGRLTVFTAACGPTVYRGDAFPAEYRGNAFVCEPAGHLVKRLILREGANGLVAEPAYARSEFLASTDERFRPVSATTGPDGALYIADMYRGILQHRIFMTSFLRAQVIERGLDRPIGLGRIYRIVPEKGLPPARVDLAAAPTARLVETLAHPNGWWRDTAQRLLVERADPAAAPGLRRLARAARGLPTRLQALWTLDGMGALTLADALAAGRDPDPGVRATAARLGERWPDDRDALALLRILSGDADRDVRVQVALSLGERDGAGVRSLLADLLTRDAARPGMRSAVASGLAGRELVFLEELLARHDWTITGAGRAEAIALLAECVTRGDSPAALRELLELAVAQRIERGWQTAALLEHVKKAHRAGSDRPRAAAVDHPPGGWAGLLACDDPRLREVGLALNDCLTWPGRRGVVVDDPAAGALTGVERERFERGRVIFAMNCASCHGADGRGLTGIAPPLAGTEGVHGSERRLARILLHGMTGAIEIDGRVYDAPMPQAAVRGDEALASVLSYVRRAWGNDAGAVEPELIRAVRGETGDRRTPWTVEELETLDAPHAGSR